MKATPVMRAIATCERWARLAICVAVLFGAQAAGAATAHIQYLSATNIYLDAGQTAGLREGMRLQVERQGRVVAEVEVEFVAGGSASCKVLASKEPLQVGDLVRFTPAKDASDTKGDANRTTTGVSATRSKQSEPGFRFGAPRGRIASIYTQATEPAGTFTNPALRADLRWSGTARQEIELRLRADRPEFETGGLANDATLRIYEAQARYRSPGERLELEGGRLLPSRLESMGFVDGGAVRLRPVSGLLLGVAGGRAAEVAVSGFAPGGEKVGGFVELSDRRTQGPRRWRALVGGALLQDPDITRRQFLLVRADAAPSPRFRFFQNLELDVHPGWMRARGEPRTRVSSYAASASARATERIDLTFGYDTRRGLLLPEQRLLPVPAERLRLQGFNTSVRYKWTPVWSLRLGGDVRLRPGGETSSRSWDASLAGARLGRLPVSTFVHATGYTTPVAHGTIVDGGLFAPMGRRLRLGLAAGTGTTRLDFGAPGAEEPVTRTHWARGDAELDLGRGVWVRGGGEWRGASVGREVSLELGRQF